MHNIGTYSQMPSRVEIRQLYAETPAEVASAKAVETDKKAQAVVDDVNSVIFSMRRHGGAYTGQGTETVQIDAVPQKLNLLQRATGFGETPVEEIANRNKTKGAVPSNVSGFLDEDGLAVTVSYEGDKEPLLYSKTQDDSGNVFFQRGKDLVTVDVNGNLVMLAG